MVKGAVIICRGVGGHRFRGEEYRIFGALLGGS